MSKEIQLTKDEIFEVIATGKCIETGGWKWGSTKTYLFERNGSKYQLSVAYHHVGGLMMYGNTLTATKVKPVEKIVIEWVEDNE